MVDGREKETQVKKQSKEEKNQAAVGTVQKTTGRQKKSIKLEEPIRLGSRTGNARAATQKKPGSSPAVGKREKKRPDGPTIN